MDEPELTRRIVGIVMASTMLVAQCQMLGLSITNAKIALRVSVFMLEEIYRNGGTAQDLEKRANELSPEVYKFIKAEIESAS